MGKKDLPATKKRRTSSGAARADKRGGKKQAKGGPRGSGASNGRRGRYRAERPRRSRMAEDDAMTAPESEDEDIQEDDVDSDAEEEYELRPRFQPRKEEPRQDVRMLPIKTAAGDLVYLDKPTKATMQVQVPKVEGVQIEEMEELASDDDPVVSDDEPQAEQEAEEEEEEDELDSASIEDLQEFQLSEERRAQLKEQIAVAATQVLQNPEEHLHHLRHLLGLSSHPDNQVARLALLSLVAVFKDVLPGYRIRLPTEKELAMQVSKEVRKLRDFESALLKHYQACLKGTLAVAQGKRGMSLAVTAVKCLCSLLTAKFSFNYASDLLQAIVPRMAHRSPAIASLCCDAVQAVFEQDVQGEATREAVQLVADLVKAKKCACPPTVVDTLLGLRVREAENASVKIQAGEKQKGRKKASKRQKRKRDEITADFEEAESKPDAVAMKHQQSDTLEVLFEIFFRVLKQTANSGLSAPNRSGPPITDAHAATKFPLLLPSLRGLVHFSHMLSVEYFADILQVLLQLIRAPGLPLRIRLECLLAASDTHRAQGEALTVDRRSLYEAFFDLLLPVPLAPLLEVREPPSAAATPEPNSGPEPSRQGPHNGAFDGPRRRDLGVLLTKISVQMLLDQARTMEAPRLAAFVRRLTGIAMQLEPGAAMGLLAVVDRMLRRNQKLRFLLDNEGGPVARVAADDDSLEAAAEQCKGGTLWELSVICRHAHPHVAQAAASILAIPFAGSAGLSHPVLSTPEGPEGVAAKYARMLFPPAGKGAKKPRSSKALRAWPFTPDFTETVVEPDAALQFDARSFTLLVR